uniref:RAD54-like protein B n=1 Tax=Pipistrellus kuhlii TaxID=59472 RepID=A0A7J7VNI4_PIPKU|nr:RAD54-like protein B [Pipistrellus kuhlii]
MRRSAAPSQLQGKPFKKPKFIPPTRSNPSLNEENTKLDPDIQLSEVAATNTFLQSQADPKIYSLNPLPAEDSGREMNHGETSALPAFHLHRTVQTWLRRLRLVPVHYR